MHAFLCLSDLLLTLAHECLWVTKGRPAGITWIQLLLTTSFSKTILIVICHALIQKMKASRVWMHGCMQPREFYFREEMSNVCVGNTRIIFLFLLLTFSAQYFFAHLFLCFRRWLSGRWERTGSKEITKISCSEWMELLQRYNSLVWCLRTTYNGEIVFLR